MNHTPAADNIVLLRQGAELLARLTPGQYTAQVCGPRGASIGAHFRHCLDFYTCLLQGLDGGQVDYDRRPRQPTVEAVPAVALALIQRLIVALERLTGPDASRLLLVRHDAPQDSPWQTSSVGRECRFLVSHTVHHFALLAPLLAAQGLTLEADFGVSASTLAHRKQQTRGEA